MSLFLLHVISGQVLPELGGQLRRFGLTLTDAVLVLEIAQDVCRERVGATSHLQILERRRFHRVVTAGIHLTRVV